MVRACVLYQCQYYQRGFIHLIRYFLQQFLRPIRSLHFFSFRRMLRTWLHNNQNGSLFSLGLDLILLTLSPYIHISHSVGYLVKDMLPRYLSTFSCKPCVLECYFRHISSACASSSSKNIRQRTQTQTTGPKISWYPGKVQRCSYYIS